MEALTFAIAASITGGEVEIHNFPYSHLEIPMIYLRESGMKYYTFHDSSSLIVKKGNIYPIEIATGPYPSINSDMQPLFAAYGLFARGKSKIIDLRFTGRYGYAEEFNKLGACTYAEGDLLIIEGGNKLSGARTVALDLRAGAALTLVGMGIEDFTIIDGFEQVLRGYNNFAAKLEKLGGSIQVEELASEYQK
jgi:UDP-N-acetylglucosamine 1-carboxyvinyltransferase